MRDRCAVGVRPREPAGLIGGLRVVHARVGQCADAGEPARFKVIEVERAAGGGVHALRAQSNISYRSCVVVNESRDCFCTSSSHKVSEPEFAKA